MASPLKGLKKPRFHSFSPEDKQMLYEGTEECFRNFLFSALRTGLRLCCQSAKLTVGHIETGPRGMM
ncbi:MAG: hypothetical protein QM775_24525 [Pirellulales bacterium]